MRKAPFVASVIMILYHPAREMANFYYAGNAAVFIVTSVVFLLLTAIIYWEISRYLKSFNTNNLAKFIQIFLILLVFTTITKITDHVVFEGTGIGILKILYLLPGVLGFIVVISFLFLPSDINDNVYFLKQFSLLAIIAGVIISFGDYAVLALGIDVNTSYIAATNGIPFIALAVFFYKLEKSGLYSSLKRI